MVYSFLMALEVDGLVIESIKLRQSAKDFYNFLINHKDIQLDIQSQAVHVYLKNNLPKNEDPRELIYALNEYELFSSYLRDDTFASEGRRLYSSLLVDKIISECQRGDFGYVLDRGTLTKFQNFIFDLISRVEGFSQLGEGIVTQILLDDTLLFLFNKV